MDWVVSAAGALLALVVLRDVFHMLFHPASEGSLSRPLLDGVWRLARRFGETGLVRAGPTGFVVVGAGWAVLLVLGFAVVYWPHLDDGFSFASQLDAGSQQGFLDALYYSGIAVSTLGFGDIVPSSDTWRLVTVVEGLVGLALATAIVSWLLSVYGALERRRSLAGTVVALVHGGAASGTLLESLAPSVQSVRTDLTQHAAAYFFRSPDPSLELAATLPALHALARAEGSPTLLASIELLAEKLGRDFLGLEDASVDAVLQAYARDHFVEELAATLRGRVPA